MEKTSNRVMQRFTDRNWLCAQLGSREHYAIPRVLASHGRLRRLLTDIWMPRRLSGLVAPFSKSLARRRHEGIADGLVRSAPFSRLLHDFSSRLAKKKGWDLIVSRNELFQRWCEIEVSKERRVEKNLLFSYSYTARKAFLRFREGGGRCILGQIDPGPEEVTYVQNKTSSYAHLAKDQEVCPPESYWSDWREEIEVSDAIIVNSQWSANLLEKAGVPRQKVTVVPLAYERRISGHLGVVPPLGRSAKLKVLFLGQLVLRKGVGELFDAIRLLKGLAVQFTFAGPISVSVPGHIRANESVSFLGPVDSLTAIKLYLESDVMILPTHSDGFALTQLEAQACGLPIIVSKNCGQVVQNRVNGLILPEVSVRAIAEALETFANDAELRRQLRENSRLGPEFELFRLSENLLNLGNSL